MNCANHADVAATAYCRTCGKALCDNCARDVRGVIYCESCIAERLGGTAPATTAATAAPGAPVAPAPASRGVASPGLAALLGFIPGVGAVYNGQYGKGLIHLIAFVIIIALADQYGPITVPLFFFIILYMVIDAYKTARAREVGEPLPDPFGINNLFGSAHTATSAAAVPPANTAAGVVDESNPGYVAPQDYTPVESYREHSNTPTGAIILIILGMLFLLANAGWFEFRWVGRLWPLLLIGMGIHLFIRRRSAVRE